ncbi:MAG TPA: TIGR03943 family protein [Anaerolineales bacterium]|nr:TIGR03943 family protein [Anaerolineales bacterium]
MPQKTYRITQAILLAGLGIYLAHKLFSGTLYYYINERFFGLVAFGAAGFLVLAAALFLARSRHVHAHADHGHDDHDDDAHDGSARGLNWGLFFVAVPLLLGVLVPESPLGASAIANRGVSSDTPLTADASRNPFQLAIPPNDRNILDWTRLYNFEPDPAAFNGETADVIGFVYKDERLGDGQFLVARFTVSCCVADAFAIGMAVDWPEADALDEISWVRVVGPVEVLELGDQTLPRIRAEMVQEVYQPDQPYLFP